MSVVEDVMVRGRDDVYVLAIRAKVNSLKFVHKCSQHFNSVLIKNALDGKTW